MGRTAHPHYAQISLGAYFDEPGPVLILASDSAGDAWRRISPPDWAVRGGANNSTLRSLGERLAVHPADERILLYGSYLDGLWRTIDADQESPQWKKVANFPGSSSSFGALSVIFDPSSPRGDTAYASVPTMSVFMSTDAGSTWRSLATAGSAPLFVNRLAISLEYTSGPFPVVAAKANGSTIFASAADGIYRYDGAIWEKMFPAQGSVKFTGIDVNPFNHLDIIAISNEAEGIARTSNGGETWQNAMSEFREIYELPWWDGSFRHNASVVNSTFGMCGNLRFSTVLARASRTPAIYIGDSWNMWRADDLGAKIVSLQQMPRGHEEVFVLSMAAPHTTRPSLVTGTADLAGLVHDDPDWSIYSNFSFFGFGAWGAEGTGVAYTEEIRYLDVKTTVPKSIVVAQARAFAANGGPLVQASADGGRTWVPTNFNNSRAVPNGKHVECLGVVVGAFDSQTMIVLVGNDRPWASTDGGQSWAAVSGGIPKYSYPLNGFSGNRYNMSRPLAAARPLLKPQQSIKATKRFGYYYADCSTGTLYASVDGRNFSVVSSLRFRPSHRCILEPHPTPHGGAFWLALDTNVRLSLCNAVHLRDRAASIICPRAAGTVFCGRCQPSRRIVRRSQGDCDCAHCRCRSATRPWRRSSGLYLWAARQPGACRGFACVSERRSRQELYRSTLEQQQGIGKLAGSLGGIARALWGFRGWVIWAWRVLRKRVGTSLSNEVITLHLHLPLAWPPRYIW